MLSLVIEICWRLKFGEIDEGNRNSLLDRGRYRFLIIKFNKKTKSGRW